HPSRSRLHCQLSPVTPPPHPYIYTLSLHDALPIFRLLSTISSVLGRRRSSQSRNFSSTTYPLPKRNSRWFCFRSFGLTDRTSSGDRKSTRLNSSHSQISYAVFCLKKKKT